MPKPLIGVIATHRIVENTYAVQAVGTRNLEALRDVIGAQPLLIPGMPETQDIPQLLEVFDGFLLTGGRPNVHPTEYGHDPSPAYEPYDQGRDAVALELVRAAVEKATPVLGICRGIQEMNVAYGGTLHPEIRDLPGRMNHRMPKGETDEAVIFRLRHPIHLTPGGVFAEMFGAEEVLVNSLHGQGILEPGERVIVEGHADDGTPEAIRIDGAPGFALGVQWHAEYDAAGNAVNRALFEAFGAAIQKRSACG
ncbi:MAG: gamma-glutamyl-gamma-aminobutyrate hydrolase family protein [Pseudomonadota bacterium]